MQIGKEGRMEWMSLECSEYKVGDYFMLSHWLNQQLKRILLKAIKNSRNCHEENRGEMNVC